MTSRSPSPEGYELVPYVPPVRGICMHCFTRPQNYDAVHNRWYDYCGKSCAVAAKMAAQQAAPNFNATRGAIHPGMCQVCHVRPKCVEGNRTHDYCSRTCASQALRAPANPSPGNFQPPYHQQVQRAQPPHAQQQQLQLAPYRAPLQIQAAPRVDMRYGRNTETCIYPGCTATVISFTQYCGQLHQCLMKEGCLRCLRKPQLPTSIFCGSRCADKSIMNAPMLLEIPETHDAFRSVESQFNASWRHGKPLPTVRRIYKIICSKQLMDTYFAYRAAVEARGHFVTKGRSVGNENRRWHGTKRECRLGDEGQTRFCNSRTCSLCSIIRYSYDINLWGKKTGWGRFGAGIYTSSTSSKANDYATNIDPYAPMKALLLNVVVVGRGIKLTTDQPKMTGPPRGYDSVLAEVGQNLNYDELVVYTNDAIRPSYLVMYDD